LIKGRSSFFEDTHHHQTTFGPMLIASGFLLISRAWMHGEEGRQQAGHDAAAGIVRLTQHLS
jgi:hypothetical protein